MFFNDPTLALSASPYFWIVAATAVLVVAIAKSGFGGAIGSLSAPIMLMVLPPLETLAVLLPLYLLTDVWSVWIWRGYCRWRLLFWMVLFSVMGQGLGYLFIDAIDESLLTVLIGTVAFITGGRYWYRWKFPVSNQLNRQDIRTLRRRAVPRASLWCSLSGFSSFVSLTGGIPLQVFLLPMRLHRFLMVGTSAWYFLSINLMKLPFFFDLGMFNHRTMVMSMLLTPMIPIGVFFGKWLNRRINDKIFYAFAHSAMLLLGLKLVLGW